MKASPTCFGLQGNHHQGGTTSIKHNKIMKASPTRFGLQGNHHQGGTTSIKH